MQYLISTVHLHMNISLNVIKDKSCHILYLEK